MFCVLDTSHASLVGVIGSDDVALDFSNATSSFADNTVGTGKLVIVSGLALSGADKENYTLVQPTDLTASISTSTPPSVEDNTPVTDTAPVASHGGGGGSFFPVTGQVLGASTTTGQVLGATTFQFTSNLHQGMRGDDVVQLQEVLRAGGYFTFPTSTGYFGPITLAAVKAYQAAHGITATGYVGPLTLAVLNSSVSVATTIGTTCPNGMTVASNCVSK